MQKEKILDDEGKEYSLDARDGWKVRKDENFHIVSESELFAPLQILENTRGALWQAGWMNPGYDTEGWEAPYRYSDMNQAVSPGNLQKRPIPFLFQKRSELETLYRRRIKLSQKKNGRNF